MANKQGASGSSIQAKAKQQREAQARSDKRMRNIIILMVVIVVLAITAAIVFVVVNRPTPTKVAQDLPEQFRDGEPIVISSEGVGVRNEDAGDLTLYYDYTCGACAQLDLALRPHLTDAAEAGDFNLLLQPVITSGHPYQYAATAGALVVAAEQPEDFVAFHEALVQYFYDAASAGDSSVYDDIDASETKVAEIAQENGISSEVIGAFNTDAATQYLELATNTWVAADIQDRDQPATPEFVTGNKDITLTGSTATAVIDELKAAVDASK